MKLTITDKAVSAYAYRDRPDLESVELTDSVKTVGEGAFQGCFGLKEVCVGHGVKQVGMRAFDGLEKNVRIVWLSKTPYRSPLYRILPEMDRIGSICAPNRPFLKTSGNEKIALACGFLLHPELESEYTDEQQESYEAFIQEELPQHMSRLVETDVILEVLQACVRRKLIKDQGILKNYISYARTRRTSQTEKQFLDAIEEEAGLLEGSRSGETLPDSDKELLRKLRSYSDFDQINRILEGQGLVSFPEVHYRDGSKAPVELIKFIFSRYISQWQAEFPEAPGFVLDPTADEAASLLDPEGFQQALSGLMTQDPSLVRRTIPALRYGTEAQLDSWMAWEKQLRDYETYGRQGMIASAAIDQAVLLSDEEKGLFYAFTSGLLRRYGEIRGIPYEEVFARLIGYLELQGMLSDPDIREHVRREYIDSLYDAYVRGTVYPRETFERWHRSHTLLREVSEALLWTETGDGLLLAHPAQLGERELAAAREEREQAGVVPAFDQLWEPQERFRVEDMEGESRRYFDLQVPLEKLMRIIGRGFSLSGSPERQLRLLFYGKCYLIAYPAKTWRSDHRMVLGSIPDASFRERELNEAIHHIDHALCFELIEAGRIGAGPYADHFTEEETRRLLDASLAGNHTENAAILLEHLKTFQKGNQDLELDF